MRDSVEAFGGWQNFVQEGDRVLLKPNFNTSDTYPGSTDKFFLKKVIEQVLELNPKKIMIGASSTLMANTEVVLDSLGIYDLERIDERVEVFNFEKKEWSKKDIPKAEYLKQASLPKILEEVDRLIFLPCLKTHFLAQYTGALKLSVGLMRPRERLSLHARNLQEKIAELNLVLKPDLIIMDARTCFISNGPMTGPREFPGLIMTSRDRVALDIEGIKMIQEYENNSLSGIKPQDIMQIKRALEIL